MHVDVSIHNFITLIFQDRISGRMRKIVPPAFFERSTPTVAQELIGKFLVRVWEGKEEAHMITETEAYHGFQDKASHASRGKTLRNTPMFARAGTLYVYYTYGMHWMLNLVCGKKGFPAGVLIRGVKEIIGPARLTKALHIDKEVNGKMLGKQTGVWIEDRGVIVPPRLIQKTPRIGIRYADEWIHKPWRFLYTKQKGTH